MFPARRGSSQLLASPGPIEVRISGMPPARVGHDRDPRAIPSTTTSAERLGGPDWRAEDRQLVEDAVGSTAKPSMVT